MSTKKDDGLSFADYVFHQVCPDNKFLDEMNEIIPWGELQEFFDGHIRRNHNKPGRPAYPIMLMFKIHLIQQWYDLSDNQAEYQIHDRLSFKKFLGLGMESDIPDSTTIENFRHLMEEQDLGKKLVKMLDDYFIKIGLIRKEGNLVDATFLRANSKHHKNKDLNSDIDAELGHKGFGFSGTINMDANSKLIRKTNTTAANVLDHQSVEEVIIGDENELYGDKGYAPARKTLKEKMKDCKIKIMHKRQRGKKNEPTPELSPKKKEANRSYSKIRSRVEHAFATMKEAFGFRRLAYRGLERVAGKFDSLAIAYNLRRLGYLVVRKPLEAQLRCA
jgi:IS5 family transposase